MVLLRKLQVDLGADFHLTRYVPDEAAELPSVGDADFVLRQLSPHCKTPPAFGQPQLFVHWRAYGRATGRTIGAV